MAAEVVVLAKTGSLQMAGAEVCRSQQAIVETRVCKIQAQGDIVSECVSLTSDESGHCTA
eukprot:scaffold217922_cov17-Tisochrysis_lutea.AAC.1